MKVLIIDDFPEYFIQDLRSLPITFNFQPKITPDEVMEIIHEYDILVLNSKVRVEKPVIDRAKNLKLAIRAGVGLDHFDLDYLAKKGILAKNTPGGNADAVAEQAIGMLLTLRHHVARANQQVKNFQWIRPTNRGHEIKGKTVGVIGYGHTGSAVAKRLQGFECEVLVYDKYQKGFGNKWVKEVEMSEIFQHANILTLHVPLTSETHFLVNETYLANFQNPITLLNLARGPVVKLEALIHGLDTGKVLYAALDVLENEKFNTLTERQQKLYKNIFSRDNVLITPHIGGWSFESRRNINNAIIRHIEDFLRREARRDER